jgi:hypothetical protein
MQQAAKNGHYLSAIWQPWSHANCTRVAVNRTQIAADFAQVASDWQPPRKI